MEKENRHRPFGVIAMLKGFITLEQFTEAIEIQTKEDLSELDHRLISEILVDLGFMDTSQVNEVLEMLLKDAHMFECPNCGVMIFECPNCGKDCGWLDT